MTDHSTDMSRRLNRIEAPIIDITFREGVAIKQVDVWREDILVNGTNRYLVLDFGVEERVEYGIDATVHYDGTQQWRPTGRICVEVQRIDPTTREGLALPTMLDVTADDGVAVIWSGWSVSPCSPRRPDVPESTETGDVATTCLMCDRPATYWDAEGSPRCNSHVGESPEDDTDD
jgi:hypothetical protein